MLVATPGRVATLLEAGVLNLEDCRAVILDEVCFLVTATSVCDDSCISITTEPMNLKHPDLHALNAPEWEARWSSPRVFCRS